ncbi:hypothetical protein [Nocardia brasiliensis]
MADAADLLTYQVVISEPDSVSRIWWRIGNVGTAAQSAAALSELAVRCRNQRTAVPTAWFWYMCEIHDGAGIEPEYFVGVVRAAGLPEQLNDIAHRIRQFSTPRQDRPAPHA